MAFKRSEPVKSGGEHYVAAVEKSGLREEAIKAVKSQHGPYVNRLKNYEDLITDAMEQMVQAGEANKTF